MLQSVPTSPYPKAVYVRNANIYKLMANPMRLEILNTLKNHEASLDQLTEMLSVSKANVSQHLRLLRQAELVKVHRCGAKAIYSIINPEIVTPCRVLYEHWNKKKVLG